MTWRDRVACRDLDSDAIWFPAEKNCNDDRRWDTARAICAVCTVRDHCLDDALDVEGTVAGSQRYGMRGGMTPDERAAEAKRRGIKQAAPLRKAELKPHGTLAALRRHEKRHEPVCDACRAARRDRDAARRAAS